MGKLKGNVRMTLDKLPGIRADLVRNDDKWQQWSFPHLVEAIQKWTVRNPVSADHHEEPRDGRRSNIANGGSSTLGSEKRAWVSATSRKENAFSTMEVGKGCPYCNDT